MGRTTNGWWVVLGAVVGAQGCVFDPGGGSVVSGHVRSEDGGLLNGIRVRCARGPELLGLDADGGVAAATDGSALFLEVQSGAGAGGCGQPQCPDGAYTCEDGWEGPQLPSVTVEMLIYDPQNRFESQRATITARSPGSDPVRGGYGDATATADFVMRRPGTL